MTARGYVDYTFGLVVREPRGQRSSVSTPRSAGKQYTEITLQATDPCYEPFTFQGKYNDPLNRLTIPFMGDRYDIRHTSH